MVKTINYRIYCFRFNEGHLTGRYGYTVIENSIEKGTEAIGRTLDTFIDALRREAFHISRSRRTGTIYFRNRVPGITTIPSAIPLTPYESGYISFNLKDKLKLAGLLVNI